MKKNNLSYIFNKNEEEIIFISNKDFIQKEINTLLTIKISKIIIIFFSILFIIFNKDKQYLRWKSLIKSIKYMNFCLGDILINKNNIKLFSQINITVIIPVYNCEKTIRASIRSIQNQNFLNFEILLVNDFSKDNSLNIIEEMQKEDFRIKIIKNQKNRGTLYSRCIGTLQAKGKYIVPLDNDDLFMNGDIFYIAFNEAEIGKYDILDFNAIRGPNYKFHLSQMIDDIFHDNPNNIVLHQPELSQHSIIKNGIYRVNNIHLWGKCIRTKIYKKAVNLLGKKKYSYFVCWAEDTAIVFILFNIASSYKYISNYGVFHLMSGITACFTQSNKNKLFGEIFLLEIILYFSKNDFKSKKYILIKIFEIINSPFFENGIKNDENRQYLNKVFNKIIICNFITKEDKEIILNLMKKFFVTANLSGLFFKLKL